MPAFMSVAYHLSLCADHIPDKTIVNQPAAGLNASTQKGIRRTAKQKPLFPGKGRQFRSLLINRRQRFFAVHMLPGKQRCLGCFVMLIGTCQI